MIGGSLLAHDTPLQVLAFERLFDLSSTAFRVFHRCRSGAENVGPRT
jgi:hypothetical protein